MKKILKNLFTVVVLSSVIFAFASCANSMNSVANKSDTLNVANDRLSNTQSVSSGKLALKLLEVKANGTLGNVLYEKEVPETIFAAVNGKPSTDKIRNFITLRVKTEINRLKTIKVPTRFVLYNGDTVIYTNDKDFGANFFNDFSEIDNGITTALTNVASVVIENPALSKPISLTDISYNALLLTHRETCTYENWNAKEIKINNPIDITVKDKGIFTIRSFCMFDVSNVKVVADLEGKKIVLANITAKPFDDNDFKIKLYSENGIYSVDGQKVYVKKDKYPKLQNIRLEIEDAKYKKIQAINVGWRMDIEDFFQNEDIRAVMTRDRIKASIMAHTNLAYTLASEEFNQIVRNIEKLIGRKLYKHEIITGMAQGSAYSFDPTGKPLRPIEESGWIFNSEADYKEFFDILGVRSETFSGRKLTTFGWGLGGYGNRHGVTNAFMGWDANHIGGGRRYKISVDVFHADAEYSLDFVSLHELGHIWGYNHACDFCSGIMDQMVIPTLTDLMQVSGKTPYTTELAKYTGKPRYGFNQVESFIYKHRNDYFKNSDLPAYLDKVKAERNKNYDTIKSKVTPPAGLPAWIAAGIGKYEDYLHKRDLELYQTYGLDSFKKL